jgi:hypothetical protein
VRAHTVTQPDAGGIVSETRRRSPTQRQVAALLGAVLDRKAATYDPGAEADVDLVDFAREMAELHERDPAAAREKARRFLED